jgi:hypothetical protein
MPSEAVNEATRREWRELGFFYELDDGSKAWRLTGSRPGLLRFADILHLYVKNPRHNFIGEHSHYGPYMYLKIMTAPKAGFDGDSIHGSLADIERLATTIEGKLAAARPGAVLVIWDDFAPGSPYALVLQVREEGFDPASADPQLPPQ